MTPQTYCGQGILATCLVGSNITSKYKCIFKNNAQDLTPYRFTNLNASATQRE